MQQIISPEYKDILASYRKLREADENDPEEVNDEDPEEVNDEDSEEVNDEDSEEVNDEDREAERIDLVKRTNKLDDALRQLVSDAESILTELDEIAKQATTDGLFDEKAEGQVTKALNSANRQIPSLNKNFELAKLTISRALK